MHARLTLARVWRRFPQRHRAPRRRRSRRRVVARRRSPSRATAGFSSGRTTACSRRRCSSPVRASSSLPLPPTRRADVSRTRRVRAGSRGARARRAARRTRRRRAAADHSPHAGADATADGALEGEVIIDRSLRQRGDESHRAARRRRRGRGSRRFRFGAPTPRSRRRAGRGRGLDRVRSRSRCAMAMRRARSGCRADRAWCFERAADADASPQGQPPAPTFTLRVAAATPLTGVGVCHANSSVLVFFAGPYARTLRSGARRERRAQSDGRRNPRDRDRDRAEHGADHRIPREQRRDHPDAEIRDEADRPALEGARRAATSVPRSDASAPPVSRATARKPSVTSPAAAITYATIANGMSSTPSTVIASPTTSTSRRGKQRDLAGDPSQNERANPRSSADDDAVEISFGEHHDAETDDRQQREPRDRRA